MDRQRRLPAPRAPPERSALARAPSWRPILGVAPCLPPFSPGRHACTMHRFFSLLSSPLEFHATAGPKALASLFDPQGFWSRRARRGRAAWHTVSSHAPGLRWSLRAELFLRPPTGPRHHWTTRVCTRPCEGPPCDPPAEQSAGWRAHPQRHHRLAACHSMVATLPCRLPQHHLARPPQHRAHHSAAGGPAPRRTAPPPFLSRPHGLASARRSPSLICTRPASKYPAIRPAPCMRRQRAAPQRVCCAQHELRARGLRALVFGVQPCKPRLSSCEGPPRPPAIMVHLTVKPTAGGSKIDLDADLDKTVGELKEDIATSPGCNIPAVQQRLVWRGQILKDERTLESYGERGGPRARPGAAGPDRRGRGARACVAPRPMRCPHPPCDPPPFHARTRAQVSRMTMCCTWSGASRRATHRGEGERAGCGPRMRAGCTAGGPGPGPEGRQAPRGAAKRFGACLTQPSKSSIPVPPRPGLPLRPGPALRPPASRPLLAPLAAARR
jgi:hypothetical protein